MLKISTSGPSLFPFQPLTQILYLPLLMSIRHTRPLLTQYMSVLHARTCSAIRCVRERTRYVPLYEGVHPVCRLDSAAGWRSACRRAGTTTRTQAGPWTLVRTDGSTWGPASLKEEERRRQIRESGRSFPTDDFFLTVCVLSICRW